MVLIQGFRSTDRFHAFFLNALVSAIIIVTAIYLKDRFDKFKDHRGNTVTQTVTWASIGVSFGVTFVASFFAYWLMYYIFGFGGGMLIEE